LLDGLGVVDEVEPNDTRWEATGLNLTEDPADTGSWLGYGAGLIDPANANDTWSDPDYWRFEALAGDVISVSIDTPESDLNPYVELRNSADGVLASNDKSGPDLDSYISHYVIPSSGTYYVRAGKDHYSATPGAYQLRVDLARGTELEHDPDFSNDGIPGANKLSLALGVPGHLVGTVAATVMAAQGANTDEDYFYLGTLDAGATVEPSAFLPSSSTLIPRIQLVDGSGTPVIDTDGDAGDGHFLAVLAASGDYYAVVDAVAGAGSFGQYLLDVDVADSVPPTVLDVPGLPAEGTTSDGVFSSFSLTFSEQMTPAAISDPAAFDLREAGADGTFDTADDLVVGLVMASSYDPHSCSVQFFLQAGPLASGDYRFTADSLLTDRAGNRLDGNADGTGGDAYRQTFTLDLPAQFVLESPDNNDRASATPLPLNEDPSASGFHIGLGLGSIDPATDEDWWSLDLLAGDRLAMAADTPHSGLNPALYLYDASGGYITSNAYSGPDHDAYISHYVTASAGTYYVQVTYYGGSLGAYQLRVETARGIDLESDLEYHNDSIANADPITLREVGIHRLATVAGTIMSPQGSNADEDRFALGVFNEGNVVELSVELPSSSALVPRIRLLDAAGNPLADEDGDPTDAHLLATITTDGAYYAEVGAFWSHQGHRYLVSAGQTWQNAEAYAQSLGGHLVTINDQAEQNWVYSTFGRFGDFWIGMSDETEEGTWIWSGGEPVDYTNWNSGEPNNSGDEDYAAMWASSGTWNDWPVSKQLPGVVELDDPQGRLSAGPGPLAQYLLDVDLSDPIPPQVTAVTRLPAEGGTTSQMFSTFAVTVSEELDPRMVNTPAYDFRTYNGHTYVREAGASRTWWDAQTYAHSLGGELVTINDQAEQDWLYGQFGSQDTWIGLNDAAADETWVWADGEEVVYTNWYSGEPNTTSHDAAYMHYGNGQWYDYPKHYGLPSLVVEFDSDADADADGLPDAIDVRPNDPFNGWDLREAGADGTFGTADDDVYELRVVPDYVAGATIDLQVIDGPIHAGQMRLTVAASLQDAVGNLLDGDGDGNGGDPYVHFFTVALPEGFTYEGHGNNDRTTATPLTLVEDPVGGNYFVGHGLGSIDPNTDEDWWSFEAAGGDRVALAVDTPESGLRTRVDLFPPAGNSLAYDTYRGPETDAYVSHYVIPYDGTYYVRVDYYSGAPGDYQLRVDLTRGVDLESDAQYENDSVAGADEVLFAGEGGGGALFFDNADDYVHVGDPPVLDLSDAVTFEAWIFPTDAGSDDPVLAKEGSGGRQAYWFGVYNGRFGLLLNDGSDGWALDARASGSIVNGRWQHIASTWDGTTWRNYLNGQIVDEGTWSGTIADSVSPLTIGSNSDYNTRKFGGALDEVRIWNRARSPEEIRATIRQQLAGSEEGLVGYWNANAEPGQTLADVSPSGNDGRLGDTIDADASDPSWLAYGAPLYGDATHRNGVIAGTVMEGESGNVDEDFFDLGIVQAGETILACVVLPESSTLTPVIEIRNASNLVVSVNPNPIDARIARVDISTTGRYYAAVLAFAGQGHFGQYLLDATVAPTHELQFADLSVSAIADLAPAASGEVIHPQWTVGNFGTAATGVDRWYDRFVLSPNDVYGDEDDVYVGSVEHTGVVPSQGDYTAQADLQLPPGISGDYWVFIETDETDQVFEFNLEDNNVARSTSQITITLTPHADLEAANVTAEQIGVAGGPFSVSYSVSNEGPGTTGDGTPGGVVAAWTDRIVFSANDVFGDGDDRFVASVPRIAALETGQSYSETWTGSLPAGLSGNYHVLVCADWGDDVYEYTDVHPNVAAAAATVTVAPNPFADLTVTEFAAPAAASTGQEIPVQWTVLNTDDAWSAAPASTWQDRIVLSQNDQYGDADDVTLGQASHTGPVGVGETYTGNLSVTIPAGIDGPHHLFIVADATNSVFEFLYENNNLDSRTIEIGQPVQILGHDPSGHTSASVSSVTLMLSDPVSGEDARDAATYELLDLGFDRAPGGGDDRAIAIAPTYSDGTTQIDLLLVGDSTVDLFNWTERDYSDGTAGDWQIEGGGTSVKQYINGYPTFFVSDFDFIDRQFTGRIKVETTGDDDYIGLVFGFQEDPATENPDDYYYLSWKQNHQSAAAGVGEEGLKILKVTDTAGLAQDDMHNLLWEGENGPHIEVLGSNLGNGKGWADNAEYDFSVRYQSNGTIDVTVRRTSDGALFWETSLTDPAPLGTGKVGFLNHSQEAVRYSGLQQAEFLEEGAYQLTARSGDPGLRDPGGVPLDGNGDGVGGDDFVATLVVDQTPPTVTDVTIGSDALNVTYFDVGGIDPGTVEDPANYTLVASGGDGTFDDGNDVPIAIAGAAFAPGAGGSGQATLTFDSPLVDQRYRLTIDGTSSVQDLAGNKLAGGDYVGELDLVTTPATVTVILQAGSDSGVAGDDITNVTEPVFDVTVNKPGVIEVDFDGDGTADQSQTVAAAGTSAFTANPFSDGVRTVTATFTPAAGEAVQGILDVTIDTEGPVLIGGAAQETAPLYSRTLTFNEPLHPEMPIDPADITVTGPQATTVTTVAGALDQYVIGFGQTVTPGGYTVEMTGATDLAGNTRAALTDAFVLLPDTTPPQVSGFTPSGLRNTDVAQLTAVFSEPIDPASFTADDVVVVTPSGPIDPAAITVIPTLADAFEIGIPVQSAEGQYQIEIGPGVEDTSGNPMAGAFQASFTIDKTGPAIDEATPSGTVATSVAHLDFTFDEPIASLTLGPDDVVLTDPGGNPIAVTGVQSLADGVYRAIFASQRVDGTYAYQIGPDVEDLAGNPMGAPYAGDFTISLPDLTVTDLAVTPPVLSGEPLQLSWNVTNAGTGAAGASFYDRIQVVNISSGETLLSRMLYYDASAGGNGPIGSGQSAARQYNYTLPDGPRGVGDLEVTITTDHYNHVVEYNADGTAETNNAAGLIVTSSMAPYPDLQVANLAVDPAAGLESGHNLLVTWDVANNGDTAADDSFYDRLRIVNTTTGETLLSTTLYYNVATAGNGPIADGDSRWRQYNFALPNGTRGTGDIEVTVTADYYNHVFEYTPAGTAETNNSATASVASELAPYPDLLVTDVVAALVGAAGEQIEVTWTVHNQGDAPAGGWTDNIYLSHDAVMGGDTYLASFASSTTLAVGESVTRTERIARPRYGTGDRWVIVRTDASNALFEHNENNNALVDDQPVTIPAALDLRIDRTRIYEQTGEHAAWATIARNSDTTLPLEVTLENTAPGDLTVPVTITIPAGQGSVNFWIASIDNDMVDGTRTATLTASAPGLVSDAASVEIIDDDVPTLTLAIDLGRLDEGQVSTATVTRNADPSQPLTVNVRSSDSTQLTVPTTVTIPADLYSATFDVQAVAEDYIDGLYSITVTASADGYLSGSDRVEVDDDDVPQLSLQLDGSVFLESAANPVATGTVTRSVVNDRPLNVLLLTNDRSELRVPYRVTIPANEATSGPLELTVVDDTMVDGTQTVTVSAHVTHPIFGTALDEGFAAAVVDVLDDDGPTLSVTVSQEVIAENAANPAGVGTVARNTDPVGQVVVTLASSDTSELTVPAEVIIPDGSYSTTFDLTVMTDGETDGTQTVSVTGEADGFNSGAATVRVSDIDLPDLRVTQVVAPQTEMAKRYVEATYQVTNTGLDAAVGSWTDRVYLAENNLPCGGTAGAAPGQLVEELRIDGPVLIGGTYERTVGFFLPAAPGTYWITVCTDYHSELTELIEGNNSIVDQSIEVTPDYDAVVQTDVEVAVAGTPIPLYGHAFRVEGGGPAAYEFVSIRVNRGSYHRTLSVFTDGNGDFEATFQPLPNEAGQYTVGAEHPSLDAYPEQDAFTLLGMRFAHSSASHNVTPAIPLTFEVELQNLADVPLAGLTASVENLPEFLDVQVDVPEDLPASGKVTLSYTLLAGDVATRTSGQIGIRVTSAEGATTVLPVNVTIIPLVARLQSNPAYLATGMLRGERTIVEFEVSNTGGVPSGDLEIRIPDVPWLSLLSPGTISLAPSQSAKVTLALNPPADLPLQRYDGTIVLAGSNTSLDVPFQFRAVSDATGDFKISVVDDFTYYAEGAPKVAGATVKLIDPIDGVLVAQGTTDASGELLFQDVVEGRYQLRVSAPEHGTYAAPLLILPGILNEKQVFIERQLVTYNWSVVPTEIEDVYKITIESTFATDVPAPVVTVDPPFVMPLVVDDEETQFELTLVNHGLIAALDVQLQVPDHPAFEIIPLIDKVDVLPAKSEVKIPVTIRAKEDGSEADYRAAQAAGLPTEFGSCMTGVARTIGGQGGLQPAAAAEGIPCLPTPKIDALYRYVCDGDVWRKERVNVEPVQVAKSVYDCIKQAWGTASSSLPSLGGNLAKAPCALVDLVLQCADTGLSDCQKALIKAACGAITGGVTGGVGGAIAGGFSGGGLGLLSCFCGLFSGGGSAPSGGGGIGGGWLTGPGSGSNPYVSGYGGSITTSGCGSSSAPTPVDGPVSPAAGDMTAICAQVRIRIEQEAVMTRTAFLGTLEVVNGYGDSSLEDVEVMLDIRDENGDPAGEMFATTGPELSKLTGVDGTGTLGPRATGSAVYTFIPTRDAAGEEPTRYQIGGTLRYLDHGTQVEVPLFPDTITVYPDAYLEFKYFHQRDVFADDPFTDVIEPSEPFSLGLTVTNVGHGAARNLRITSAQPEIIENEKGLLIDFKIIGTRVGNEEVSPSLTADLGNIEPGATQVADWLLVSTLQGQFVDYDATFEHVTGLGNPQLSLIKSVEIHEMIHVVRADRPADDDLPDFLVNDIDDVDVLPDMLYMSDGTTAAVNVATDAAADGQATIGDMQVELTASQPSGWSYLRVDDPGQGQYAISRVVRSDGKELLVGPNIWQTDRTFSEADSSFRRENVLHLFDYDGTGSYTLYYRVDDSTPPQVAEIVEVDPDPRDTAVSSIDVVFSEPIDLASFTYEDLTLTLDFGENPGLGTASETWVNGTQLLFIDELDGVTPGSHNEPVSTFNVIFSREIDPATFDLDDISLTRDGGANLIHDGVTITSPGGNVYEIGGLATLTTPEGNYLFAVDATGVQDPGGNAGLGSASVAWTMDTTGPTVAEIEDVATDPRSIVVQSLDVTLSEEVDPDTFTPDDLTLTLNAGPNLIDQRVTIEHVEGTTYRIAGFNWVVGLEGTYELTVDLTDVQDAAGNFGTDVASESWVMDTGAPDAPTDLAISPDRGVLPDDGVTNTLTVTLTGSLSEPGLSVRLIDETRSENLGYATVDGTTLSKVIEFESAGTHRIRVRAVDAAGNLADSFFDVFIDVTPPTVAQVDLSTDTETELPTAIDVEFSEPLDVATMIADGSILSAVTLVSLREGPIALDVGQFAYDDAGRTLTVSLDALADQFTGGYYELRIDGSTLSDAAGNLLRGGAGGIVVFDFPALAAAENVQAGALDIDVDVYSVPSLADWNSDGRPDLIVGEKVGMSTGKVRVYLNQGTAATPVFGDYSHVQSNGGDLSVPAGGCQGAFPRVFDFNRDGMKDLLVGTADGKVMLLENINTDADPHFGSPTYVQVGQPGAKADIDVGDRATLDLVDWNNDGNYDLVLGALDGRIRVLLNEAATGPADFRAQMILQDDAGELAVPSGRASVAVFDFNDDGRKDILAGNSDGQVLFYANQGTDAAPVFDGSELLRADGTVIDLAGSPRSRPFVGDFNDDGIPDLLLGAQDGLVRLYAGQSEPATSGGVNINDGEPGGLYVYTFEIQREPVVEEQFGPAVLDGPIMSGFHLRERYLADDFVSSATGFLTEIVVWGAYLGDVSLGEPPLLNLAIFANVPAAQSGAGYDMPGEALWNAHVEADVAELYLTFPQGTTEPFFDPDANQIIGSDTRVWQYTFTFDPDEAFLKRKDQTYWLGVSHSLDLDGDGAADIDDAAAMFGNGWAYGWKAAIENSGEGAVWLNVSTGDNSTGELVPPADSPWNALKYPPGHELAGQNIDLAFHLTSQDLTGPLARFSFEPQPQDEGAAVQFTDASIGGPSDVVAWAWDFAGLGSSGDPNPTFTFTDDGTYTVTLTVTDDDGSTRLHVRPGGAGRGRSGALHRRLDQCPRRDRAIRLGFRRAGQQQRSEPDVHLHRRRHLHGHADGDRRRRFDRHRLARGDDQPTTRPSTATRRGPTFWTITPLRRTKWRCGKAEPPALPTTPATTAASTGSWSTSTICPKGSICKRPSISDSATATIRPSGSTARIRLGSTCGGVRARAARIGSRSSGTTTRSATSGSR